MADFELCFKKVIEIEGGFKLINIQGDNGGMTYAGISRNNWPNWAGWIKIDNNQFDTELSQMVKLFYKEEFWDKIKGDIIGFQSVAYNIYAFAVNTGLDTSIKICQKIVNVKEDGIFGNSTLKALNEFVTNEKDEKIFVLTFSLLKVFRYNSIVLNDKRRKWDLLNSNQKFLCGWINRVQEGLKYWKIKWY